MSECPTLLQRLYEIYLKRFFKIVMKLSPDKKNFKKIEKDLLHIFPIFEKIQPKSFDEVKEIFDTDYSYFEFLEVCCILISDYTNIRDFLNSHFQTFILEINTDIFNLKQIKSEDPFFAIITTTIINAFGNPSNVELQKDYLKEWKEKNFVQANENSLLDYDEIIFKIESWFNILKQDLNVINNKLSKLDIKIEKTLEEIQQIKNICRNKVYMFDGSSPLFLQRSAMIDYKKNIWLNASFIIHLIKNNTWNIQEIPLRKIRISKAFLIYELLHEAGGHIKRILSNGDHPLIRTEKITRGINKGQGPEIIEEIGNYFEKLVFGRKLTLNDFKETLVDLVLNVEKEGIWEYINQVQKAKINQFESPVQISFYIMG